MRYDSTYDTLWQHENRKGNWCIKENELQAEPQTSQTVFILHRTQSRGRSEPPMNNGAIFVKRVAPHFLPVMLRRYGLSFSWRKFRPNFASAIRRQAKRIRLNGIVLYENSRWGGEARRNVQRTGKTVAQQKYSWRKLKAPPTAVCSLPSRLKRSIGSDGEPFLTKIYFSSGGRAGFLRDLIYLTPLIIISWPKWIFRHEGLATVLRDGIWSLAQSFSWRKSPLFSLRRPDGGLLGFGSLSLFCRPLGWEF